LLYLMTTLRLLPAMLACCAISFSSCNSDNDDNYGFGEETDDGVTTVDRIDPSQVFTGLKPVSVAGMQISYMEDGLVKQIIRRADGENEFVSFSYPALARSVSEGKLVRMDIVSGTERHQYDMRVGNMGFVDYAEETEYENGKAEETQYWWFSYTPDGHLESIEGTKDDHKVTKFYYSDGNIIGMTAIDRDGDSESASVDYGATPIANVGAVMLFDEIFDTDVDDIIYIYYAGLLGKATKNLPVSAVQTEGKQSVTVSFAWTLDAGGYPVMMTPSDEPYSYTFAWK
ncbi:MAG: DUF4595 domain-containing protein, partial [Muribaculaceae bacterium]|nr:DUF4595 domain-containing protein [Muribaculaceae bacterium]